MNLGETWNYSGHDSCGAFFTSIVKESQIDLRPDALTLEIGCAEFDWITEARRCWPEMIINGIDWRESSFGRRANALEPDAYRPNAFDLIVSISAVEHFGLGHYEEDPLDVDGDTHIIANAFKWLKVGGWLLFDVPYTPEGFTVHGTSHRSYDYDALFLRLWVEGLAQAKATARWVGEYYCKAGQESQLIPKPTETYRPFYYVGLAWQKVG